MKVAPDQMVNFHFPLAGVDRFGSFASQRPRKTYQGRWAKTTPDALNVRGFDWQEGFRGGSRPGLSRYVNARVNGRQLIQSLTTITGVTYTGSGMQYSQQGRVVTLVPVSGGYVYSCNAGDTSWTLATNNTGQSPPLNATGIIFSAANGQKLYFADGTNWVKYNPNNNNLSLWTASAGSLPVDSDGNKPRLICTWRGRTVLSGLLKDPQNWFMSKVDDPTNFDYGPLSPSPTQAVAGNDSPLGLIGDIITALIPASDDVLVVGGDHTLYVMRGDPADGGRIDRVSDTIGIAWGQAWCQGPDGTIYFVSNKLGVYAMSPGGMPQRLSQPIERALYDIDTGSSSVRLIWNDRYQGFHIFVTPLASPQETTHYFYEARSGAWWPDKFGNNLHNPMCCCTFDGNLPGDRVPLIGSWDGYVRSLDATAADDDGTPIESKVLIGPFISGGTDDVEIKDCLTILASESGKVNYELLTGTTCQEAIESEASESGEWEAGRNILANLRRAAFASYLRLTSTERWAFELARLRIESRGGIRERQYVPPGG